MKPFETIIEIVQGWVGALPKKWPSKLGEAIDLFYEIRTARLDLDKQVKILQERQDALELHLINNFKKTELEGAKGRTATAALTHPSTAIIVDWPKFWDYVKKNDAPELLHKRAALGACKERWEQRISIPGVEEKKEIGLSVTKAGSK